MNSLLKALSFICAVGLPGVLVVQLAGARVSAPAAPGYLFFGLFGSLFLLTLLVDYTRPVRRPARLVTNPRPAATVTPIRALASPHRLAA